MNRRRLSLAVVLALALPAGLLVVDDPTRSTSGSISAGSEISPDGTGILATDGDAANRGRSEGQARLPEQANERADEATDSTGSNECVHPYPCGDEWPDGLEGPFELAEVRHVFVEVSDGVEIEGWVAHPELPNGVAAPTVMVSTPYLYACGLVGQMSGPYCLSGPGDDAFWADPPNAGPIGNDDVTWHVGVPPIRLVHRGFAVAYFATRGTANSGGCFEWGSRRRQRDQGELVEWVAGQAWSNGRVGMAGLSALAWTAAEGAAEHPTALKTVVMGGVMTDLYTWYATPQGAWHNGYSLFTTPFFTEQTLYPDPFHPERMPGRVPREPDRACPGFVDAQTKITTSQPRQDRDAEFFAERRLIDRFDEVTASVLVMAGFDDDQGHRWQEEEVWEALTQAPTHMVLGPWGHTWPTESDFSTYDPPQAAPEPAPYWGQSFEDLLYSWYEYWLKGEGDVPAQLDTVDHQDRTGMWRSTTAWPPADATNEALYLAGESLRAEGEPGARSYHTLGRPGDAVQPRIDPDDLPDYEVYAALCHGHPLDPLDSDGLGYLTAPQTEAAVVAGNPHGWLHLISDAPAGVIDVRLVDVGPDFGCDEFGQASGYRQLGTGAVDLRFHAGNFVERDFPVGVVTPVRVDFPALSHRLEVGHRLALVMGQGENYVWNNTVSAHQPTITVVAGSHDDSSHLVVPVVEGSLGGAEDPDVASPRPFGPDWTPSP
jgi:putative CocE/NonD family hydrolase